MAYCIFICAGLEVLILSWKTLLNVDVVFVHERWLIILENNSDLDSSIDDFSEYLLSSDAVNKKNLILK